MKKYQLTEFIIGFSFQLARELRTVHFSSQKRLIREALVQFQLSTQLFKKPISYRFPLQASTPFVNFRLKSTPKIGLSKFSAALVNNNVLYMEESMSVRQTFTSVNLHIFVVSLATTDDGDCRSDGKYTLIEHQGLCGEIGNESMLEFR